MARDHIPQTEALLKGFRCAVILFLATSATVSIAHAETSDEGHVTLNTRTFDLATDATKMRREPDFVPMNDIDWLDPILDADSALGPTVFHVVVMDKSNKSAEGLWSFNGNRGRNFRYNQNIPERFVIEGLETRSYHKDSFGSVMMVPMDPTADYAVNCDLDPNADRVMYCQVLASYPPDPLIFLRARLYFPSPWHDRRQQIGAIAARMRGIAYCLDVTDKSLEFLADGTPDVTDCRGVVGM